MTGLDLISSSLRLIGVLASGETPSGNEAADALLILQQMIDSWQTERLNIFTINIQDFPLVAGQQTYTLGVGGNFNTTRPTEIESISVIWLANPSQPLELPLEMLTDKQWQYVPVKAVNSTLPVYVYDDGNYPLRSLNFWPIPTVVDNIRIYGWQTLNTFPDLTTDILFPPGYLKAIRYNLAVDLAPEFGRSAPPEVGAQAILSKAKIKLVNAPIVDSTMPSELIGARGSIYNWLSDTWRKR